MKTYRISLTAHSAALTPFHADTIFGHLCWVVAYEEGMAGVTKFLQPFKDGDPPFILSDGFPGNFLPKPLSVDFTVDDPDERKEIRKADLILFEDFFLMQKGMKFSYRKVDVPIKTSLTIHNTVNRLSNTTLTEGGLYSLEESCLAPDVHITIYIKAKDGEETRVEELFRALSNTGYGRKKSIGKGHFSLAGHIEEFKGFDEVRNQANGFVTLSSFCPEKGDPIEGFYKTFVKYGKLGEEFTFSGNPFKKPMVMIRTGSVFSTGAPPKEVCGRMVEGVSPSRGEVLQYGYAFPIPMMLSA